MHHHSAYVTGIGGTAITSGSALQRSMALVINCRQVAFELQGANAMHRLHVYEDGNVG